MKLLYILKESLLTELFDKPYQYSGPVIDYDSGDDKVIEYSFLNDKGEKYVVYFDSILKEDGWVVEVSFEYLGGEEDSGSQKLTGKYDVRVLSTVFAILSKYVQEEKPYQVKYEGIKDEAESSSIEDVSKRAKLYKSIFEKHRDVFKDYDVKFERSTGVFTRKEKS